MLESIIAVAGFMTGGFLTALGFILKYQTTISTLQHDVNAIKETLKCITRIEIKSGDN
jgi:hypothetical protein